MDVAGVVGVKGVGGEVDVEVGCILAIVYYIKSF